ncbi:hypothetical protein [Candidatus Chlorohelix sp.]|uniref:hypothetical protein n=1 Tax=Candidatus Chlorohelix sp. TaxID=3139201 RepID=UPI0030441AC6
MIIKPDNRYTRRFALMARVIPAAIFVLLGGGLLFYTALGFFSDSGSKGWVGGLVSFVLTGLLCFLMSIMMSRRGFDRLLERMSTRLSPESIFFDNRYFGSVQLNWSDITDVRLCEQKGNEGIFFKLEIGSITVQDFADLLLRGKDLERAQGYQWRMTPDLYDRPTAEMYVLITRYWREPSARLELAEEVTR